MSLQPEVPINDGRNEVFHDPQPHHHGWPTIYIPLPPPPPNKPLQHVVSISSHALSAHDLNKDKALAHKYEPRKWKQSSMLPSSNSSSHYMTLDSIPKEQEPKNISFGDMHPDASYNEDKEYSKEDS